MIYQWKEAFPYKKAEAQKVGEFLETLSEKIGDIRPSQVVEESKPKEAILHDYFIWDNDKAGKLFREEQARHIIKSIVVVKTINDQPATTRAFVSIRNDENERKYINIDSVLDDEIMTQQMLSEALKELQAFRQKYSILQQLSCVFDAIDKLTA